MRSGTSASAKRADARTIDTATMYRNRPTAGPPLGRVWPETAGNLGSAPRYPIVRRNGADRRGTLIDLLVGGPVASPGLVLEVGSKAVMAAPVKAGGRPPAGRGNGGGRRWITTDHRG